MDPGFESSLTYTLGVAFCGYTFSCVALGVFFTQVMTYWVRYPRDKWIYKVLVVGVGLIEVADQLLISHALYYYNITHFGSFLTLINEPVIWSIIIHTIVGAVIGVIVKFCFAVRVWRFSKHNLFITGLIVLLNLGELGLATGFTIKSFEFRMFGDLPKIKVLGTISLGCGVLTDILVAASLCFYLQRIRSDFRQAGSLVTTLSIYALSTGIATSAVGLAVLICYYLMPLNFIFLSLYFLLSKLYGISLLSALNTRQNTDREHVLRSTSNSSNISIYSSRNQDRLKRPDSLTTLPPRITRTRSWRTTSSRQSLLGRNGHNASQSSLGSSVPQFSMQMMVVPEESYHDIGTPKLTLRNDSYSVFSGDNRSRFSESSL